MQFAEYIETRTGGWRHNLERRNVLAATSTPRWLTAADDARLPDFLDCGDWSIVEAQGNQGSCQGHDLSTCVEAAIVRQGGPLLQLSRAQAYYESQRIDGIRGDSGSTIEGGIRLARETGLCAESDWPYPNQYDPQRPGNYDQSKKYKIDGHVEIKDWDSAIRHLGLVGPISIGIMWGNDIDQQVSRSGVIQSYRGVGGGGHAIALLGYRRTHFDGSDLGSVHIDLYNSWSKSWGKNGRCLVTKAAFDAMVGHRHTVMIGIIGPKEVPRPSY